MRPTKSDIFWKCWWWSAVCGTVVAIFFYTITNIDGLFHWSYGGATFINLLVLLSFTGCYFGAGYVGWRFAEKYYYDPADSYLKRYIRYSILTFLLLVAVAYSPLSFLGVLWSLVAPGCVLLTLSHLKEQFPPAKKTRRVRRRPA